MEKKKSTKYLGTNFSWRNFRNCRRLQGSSMSFWICHKYQTKIIILNPVSETEDRTKELAEGLFSIVTVFVAKNNGLIASNNRQNRKKKKKKYPIP